MWCLLLPRTWCFGPQQMLTSKCLMTQTTRGQHPQCRSRVSRESAPYHMFSCAMTAVSTCNMQCSGCKSMKVITTVESTHHLSGTFISQVQLARNMDMLLYESIIFTRSLNSYNDFQMLTTGKRCNRACLRRQNLQIAFTGMPSALKASAFLIAFSF